MRDRRDLLININLLLLAIIGTAAVAIIFWKIVSAIFSVLMPTSTSRA